MPRGGVRPGSGRKKGQVPEQVLARRQVLKEVRDAVTLEGETPLEYMLRVMRTSDDTKRKDAMAIAAAPFVHPKLAAVEHSGDKENPLTMAIVSSVPRDGEEFLNGHANGHAAHN